MHKISDVNLAAKKQHIGDLAQNGKFAEARTMCIKLCKKAADDPEAWFLLGAIHGSLEEYDEAEQCCRKALVTAPDHPVLNFNLGVALIHQNKADEAIPFLIRATNIQSDYTDAYRELANAHALLRQHEEAIKSYKIALKLEPRSAITYYNLGNVLRDRQHPDDAIEHYENAISLQPDFKDACIELAKLLIYVYRYKRAIETLTSAIKFLPEDRDLHYTLGVVYQEEGLADDAMIQYKKTLALDSNNTDAQIRIAGILGLQGEAERAMEQLKQIMDAEPDNIDAISTYAQFADKHSDAIKAISLIEEKLKNDQLSDEVRCTFHFAIARLFDRLDNYEVAFEHYHEGNNLKFTRFNIESYRSGFDSIIETFNPDTMNSLPRSGIKSSMPVFIVGMPRSGTTLVEQILASHTEVFGAGELPNIMNLVSALPTFIGTNNGFPACINELTEAHLHRFAQSYLDYITKKSSGVRFVTDKMPSNYIHLGFINLLFPGAKIIHCIRDPMDTCLSCYFKNFSGEHAYAYNLSDIGQYYRLYETMMTHWKKVTLLPVYEIHYENLVTNQDTETRKLLDFCNLDWEDECLNFHETRRTVSTASHAQVRRPLHTKSIGRWKNYEKQLKPLIFSLNDVN